MDWSCVEASWQTFRGEVQANWGRLTSDHLDAIAGRRVCLAKKLEEAYGVTGPKPSGRSGPSKHATRTPGR